MSFLLKAFYILPTIKGQQSLMIMGVDLFFKMAGYYNIVYISFVIKSLLLIIC